MPPTLLNTPLKVKISLASSPVTAGSDALAVIVPRTNAVRPVRLVHSAFAWMVHHAHAPVRRNWLIPGRVRQTASANQRQAREAMALSAERGEAGRPSSSRTSSRSPSSADSTNWLLKLTVTHPPLPSLAASAIVRSASVISRPPWTILLELQ